jgi:hypothetical protein
VNCVAFLLLPLALYRLFHAVNRPVAILMVAFALMSIPISLVSAANELDVLWLLKETLPLQAVSVEDRQAIVLRLLTAYDNGMFVAQLFWGLWLLPLGLLILESRAVPRILGVLLLLGGLGYLIQVIGGVLSSSFGQSPLSRYATLPAAAGETGLGLWLLLRGVRQAHMKPTRHYRRYQIAAALSPTPTPYNSQVSQTTYGYNIRATPIHFTLGRPAFLPEK